jgi:hypothetical protein
MGRGCFCSSRGVEIPCSTWETTPPSTSQQLLQLLSCHVQQQEQHRVEGVATQSESAAGA